MWGSTKREDDRRWNITITVRGIDKHAAKESITGAKITGGSIKERKKKKTGTAGMNYVFS